MESIGFELCLSLPKWCCRAGKKKAEVISSLNNREVSMMLKSCDWLRDCHRMEGLLRLNKLDEETQSSLKNAPLESNMENSELIAVKLKEMKERLTDQSGLNGPRNDFFLLRFLRAKQFDVGAALVLLRNYEGWRKSHGQSWLTIDKSVIQQVLQSGVIQILPEKDNQGRRLFWLRVGLWRPRDFSADTLLQVGALCGELALLDSGTQINGAVAVFDMRGLGLQQLKVVTPAFARKMVHYLADCISLKINAVHVMNDSVLFAMIFAIFKKFLDDSMKKRIFFHGNNMYSLHEHVDSSYLPKELGGELPSQDGAQLLAVISSDAVIKELERIGYTFLEAK